MSATLFNLGGLLGVTTWVQQLKPASFRGVPFFVRGHEQDAGRRVVGDEYPLRDVSDSEDMGRQQEHYQVDAYVLGNDYLAQASALYSACVLSSDFASLVHPYLGQITCRCVKFRRSEKASEGGIARFHLTFLEAGGQPSPLASVDTASSSLGFVTALLQSAAELYSLAVVVANHPGFLLGFLGAELEIVGNGVLGLPGGTLQGFAALAAAVFATPSDMDATPAAITAAFSTYADGVAQAPDGTYPNGNDPSFGLTGYATFGSDWPAVPQTTPDRIQQATNQATVILVTQACAAAATAQVYAQTTFVSSNAATAARNQLTDWLDCLAVSAADAGWTDLYSSLTDLYAAVVADMTARAQQLPSLVPYETNGPMPSLTLAQLLYQDPTRACQLVELNDAEHPGFMPPTGVALFS